MEDDNNMQQLRGALRNYPWGSRTLMADLRGTTSPSDRPEAELWFGAHPGDPAMVGEESLLDLINEDPQYQLGERVTARYGNRLPFLMKLLAAGEPLSLQAHPSTEQAQEGFARENAEGIDIHAPNRNYKDADHKPELIVALTEFHALSGFRPLDKTRELFAALECPELDRYAAVLGDDADLRALFTTWITIPSKARTELIDAIIAAASDKLDRGDWISDSLRCVTDLNNRYPGDIGVLGALLLNFITLQPGEALFTDAGQLHAYMDGLGVEVMANSDNVLRGGLTAKHVDVPELVKVLVFETTDAPRVKVVDGTYETPIDEFQLTAHTLGAHESVIVDSDGPAIVMCTAGSVVGTGEAGANPGDALWVPAGENGSQVTAGSEGAQIFVARA